MIWKYILIKLKIGVYASEKKNKYRVLIEYCYLILIKLFPSVFQYLMICGSFFKKSREIKKKWFSS